MVRRIIKATEHRILAFADRKAAHGIAIEPDVDQRVGRPLAQFFIKRTLLDAEQGGPFGVLSACVKSIAGSLGPTHRQLHRLDRFFAADTVSRTFVESHDDVRPQQSLDFHRAFGAEHMLRSVEMALERHTLFGNFAKCRKAHHLIAAAVGQYRSVPAGKLMQASQPRNALRAGAEHKVIGVSKDNVCTRRTHLCGPHCLHRCSGTHGHKCRRSNVAAQHGNSAGTRLAVGGGDFELKSRSHCQRISRLFI